MKALETGREKGRHFVEVKLGTDGGGIGGREWRGVYSKSAALIHRLLPERVCIRGVMSEVCLGRRLDGTECLAATCRLGVSMIDAGVGVSLQSLSYLRLRLLRLRLEGL